MLPNLGVAAHTACLMCIHLHYLRCLLTNVSVLTSLICPSPNRKFVKGDAGMKKAVATRIAGSADLYQTNSRCQLTAHVAAATAAAYLMLEGASLPSERIPPALCKGRAVQVLAMFQQWGRKPVQGFGG